MRKIKGIAASNGIAIGKLALCVKLDDKIIKQQIVDIDAELARVNAAKEQAVHELNGIYLNTLKRVGEDDSMIFQIHIMMIQDDDFFKAIQNMIKEEKINAEYAVWQVAQQFSNIFAKMKDEYMRGRGADVVDISKRLLSCLNPELGKGLTCLKEEAIVAVTELMPSETVQMDKSKVLAFITQKGSRNSHSAILARTLGIPSVVGLCAGFEELKNGAVMIADGTAGELILEPDAETLCIYKKRRQDLLDCRQDLEKLRGTKAISQNGVCVKISANIGSPNDIGMVIANDAEGIGLFRSEFLYMESDDFPTEEVQFEAYKTVLQRMKGKRVIIRTLDLGADKQVPYLNIAREDNPAMGYRAIRICLGKKEMFLTQLRALLRASAYGCLAVMFPMITSVEQVKQIKDLMEQAKKELRLKDVMMASNIELGIMIETPASVMLSDELAKEVDFFSIGTNDLTQYTLAVDRVNPSVCALYDPGHPAVLRMIQITVKSARDAGIWVSICGESAADTKLIKFYLSMGVEELSVAPSAVLEVRKAVQETTVG